MDTLEVAKKLVAFCQQGTPRQAMEALYAGNVVSVEPPGAPELAPGLEGKEKARAKFDRWEETMEVHQFVATGPYVSRDKFVVQFEIDAVEKKSGERTKMSEVGIYTVENGKISREEFLPMAE